MVLANANANGTQQTPGVLSASSDGLPSQGSAATLGSNIGNESENEDVPMIDKAQALERLKQARKRRTQQLKKYSQYEKQLEKDAQKKKKLLTSSDDAASARSRRVQFSQNLLLLEAASRGDLDEVAALLARGISPDSANEDGLTALHQVCVIASTLLLSFLLSCSVSVSCVFSLFPPRFLPVNDVVSISLNMLYPPPFLMSLMLPSAVAPVCFFLINTFCN